MVVSESRIQFRHGVPEFMAYVKDKEVAMTVMSAGLGDVIDLAFKEITQDQIKIIANFIDFSGDTSLVTDFKTTMNKQSHYYKSNPELTQNVILMGDVLEDAHMVNPEKHDQVLRVGFCN